MDPEPQRGGSVSATLENPSAVAPGAALFLTPGGLLVVLYFGIASQNYTSPCGRVTKRIFLSPLGASEICVS